MLALRLLLALVAAASAQAAPVQVTLLHTNDLHSHFRPDGGPLALGGIARLKTAIDRERAAHPNSVLVDGGDWSEGDIYYIAGAGSETLRMMGRLGYDVAVVGNHDWLNGPDALLDAHLASSDTGGAGKSPSLVAANIEVGTYARAAEFKREIPPYAIREVAGVKIAFVGLVTYEFIYDSFFQPVSILPLQDAARAAASDARAHGADAVVVISHNATDANLTLLHDVPGVDLVIGAHDHILWTRPQIQAREGAPDGWVVEAGKWGQNLGRVTLTVTPAAEAQGKPQVKLEAYDLVQIDSRIPEDAAIAGAIPKLEAQVEQQLGPIFHDHVGDSEAEISWPSGTQDPLGTLNADAYREATGADFAIESRGFVYGEIHPGELRSVDIFRSNPGVYSPKTGKAWTVSTMPITGKKLQWLLNFVVTSGQSAGVSGLSASGLELVFAYANATDKPSDGEIGGSSGPSGPGPGPARSFLNQLWAAQGFTSLLASPPPAAPARVVSGIQSITIGGQPIDPDRTYQFAMSGGVRSALEFVELLLPGTLQLKEIRDTGKEAWRLIADRIRALSPLTIDKVQTGNRIRSAEADLGLFYDDVQATPSGVSVRVRNFGSAASAPGAVELVANRMATDLTRDADWTELAPSRPLPSIAPGAAASVVFENATPLRAGDALSSVTARVSDGQGAVLADQTRFFK